MKMLPGMTVINTCDFNQTKLATIAIADHNGPVYLRFGRPKVPNFTSKDFDFKIGKGIMLKEGKDVTIVSTGHLVWESIEASKKLEEIGISSEIINIHTIKPLDEEIIISSVKKTNAVVSAEEHNYLGGLGESVSRTLSTNYPVPQEFIATNDTFGESGTPFELMKKYGLDSDSIVESVKKVISRK